MNVLITRSDFSSYSHRPVVWYVAEKEAEEMRKTLENFILGFRLGARVMAECMDGNDGDIRNGGE